MKPHIFAIAGGSGSGKTTIAKKIQQHCSPENALLFQTDHYYRDLAHLSPEERDRVNFDHPDAVELSLVGQHLKMLASGKSIDRPTYEFASHTRSSKVERIDPKPMIIVDGIFALYDQTILEQIDYGIFVDVSDDIRFIRRLKRDMEERGRTLDNVTKQYLATVKPMYDQYVAPSKKNADFVVFWDHYNDRTIELLANLIQNI